MGWCLCELAGSAFEFDLGISLGEELREWEVESGGEFKLELGGQGKVGMLALWVLDGIPVCQKVGFDAGFHEVDDVGDASNALRLLGGRVVLQSVGLLLVLWVG